MSEKEEMQGIHLKKKEIESNWYRFQRKMTNVAKGLPKISFTPL